MMILKLFALRLSLLVLLLGVVDAEEEAYDAVADDAVADDVVAVNRVELKRREIKTEERTEEGMALSHQPKLVFKPKATPKDNVALDVEMQDNFRMHKGDEVIEDDFTYDYPDEEEDLDEGMESQYELCDQHGHVPPICMCKKPRKKVVNDKWIGIENAPIEVYSAYLDLRKWDMPEEIEKEEGTYTIRVISHGLQKQFPENVIPKISCAVMNNGQLHHIGEAYYLRIYPSRAHADEYTAHFLICQVPNVLPFHQSDAIYLSLAACSQSGVLMKINKPDLDANLKLKWSPQVTSKPAGSSIKLGVCVSPLYGKNRRIVNPISLVEFIETHILLGIDHFTFYKHDITEAIQTVLNYYISKGIVTLVDWSSLHTSVRYFYFDQRSALNDCLYKNMGKVTYLGIIDLDEVLTPTEHFPSLRSMIESTVLNPDVDKKKTTWGSFCFSHVLFHPERFEEREEVKDLWPELVFQRRYIRTKMYPAGIIRTKCMHAPEYMVATDIHFGQWWVNKSIEQMVLPEEAGILQHYRPHLFEKMISAPEEFQWFAEKRLLLLRQKVLDKITEILIRIGLGHEIGQKLEL